MQLLTVALSCDYIFVQSLYLSLLACEQIFFISLLLYLILIEEYVLFCYYNFYTLLYIVISFEKVLLISV